MMSINEVGDLLRAYRLRALELEHDSQSENARLTLSLLEERPNTWWTRSEFLPGHITASAWVVNKERTHVLLVKHLVLKQLFQPGGHIECVDRALHEAALREAREESGIEGTLPQREIFDIDIHTIPERPSRNEPQHTHYDVRFLVETPYVEPKPLPNESIDIFWVPLSDVLSNRLGFNESIQRMAQKTL